MDFLNIPVLKVNLAIWSFLHASSCEKHLYSPTQYEKLVFNEFMQINVICLQNNWLHWLLLFLISVQIANNYPGVLILLKRCLMSDKI